MEERARRRMVGTQTAMKRRDASDHIADWMVEEMFNRIRSKLRGRLRKSIPRDRSNRNWSEPAVVVRHLS